MYSSQWFYLWFIQSYSPITFYFHLIFFVYCTSLLVVLVLIETLRKIPVENIVENFRQQHTTWTKHEDKTTKNANAWSIINTTTANHHIWFNTQPITLIASLQINNFVLLFLSHPLWPIQWIQLRLIYPRRMPVQVILLWVIRTCIIILYIVTNTKPIVISNNQKRSDNTPRRIRNDWTYCVASLTLFSFGTLMRYFLVLFRMKKHRRNDLHQIS